MNVSHIKAMLKILIVVSVLGLLVFAFLPEPVNVDIGKVVQGDVLVTIEGEGQTRIHDIYVVSAPVDGRVTRIESEPGDKVIAGKTVIANMHPANPHFLDKRSEIQAKADVEGARAALALASARVKQVQAQLDFDLADFKRTKALFNKESISKAGLDRAALRLNTLKAELETAKSNQRLMQSRLASAKVRLLQPNTQLLSEQEAQLNCQICIHSPVDGRLLRVLHKSEGIVPVGTPLVEVGNPEDLEVNIEMLSTNAVKVDIGDTALIKRWGGQQDIKAIVRVIEPSGFTKISALGVEEQRVNIILSFTDPIEKWRRLGDAFRVEAAIIIDRAEHVITAPLSALFRDNEQWSVFKVVDGKATLQTVTIGRQNDEKVEILAGLAVNDHIILHPGNQLEDGDTVKQR